MSHLLRLSHTLAPTKAGFRGMAKPGKHEPPCRPWCAWKKRLLALKSAQLVRQMHVLDVDRFSHKSLHSTLSCHRLHGISLTRIRCAMYLAAFPHARLDYAEERGIAEVHAARLTLLNSATRDSVRAGKVSCSKILSCEYQQDSG